MSKVQDGALEMDAEACSAMVLMSASASTVVERADMLATVLDQLPALPTEDLVSGFVQVERASKMLSTFTDAVKKELVTNAKKDVPASGRFFAEDAEVDEKGHRYLIGANGERLQAQKRVSTSFDVEKAAALLRELGLWEQGTEKVEHVAPIEEVKQTHDELLRLVDESATFDCAESHREFERLVGSLIHVAQGPSETKVEALVTLGLLPVARVNELMTTTITYAVIPPKAKK